ncbi:hypothetical protein NESM_000605900 [Novymonas esmeraldas]|uniref:Uncharacterized protein n=1 Tax=Novymonas esmeraldas TaxID=1808958 RepID=A0AAW0EV65_9TRYP
MAASLSSSAVLPALAFAAAEEDNELVEYFRACETSSTSRCSSSSSSSSSRGVTRVHAGASSLPSVSKADEPSHVLQGGAARPLLQQQRRKTWQQQRPQPRAPHGAVSDAARIIISPTSLEDTDHDDGDTYRGRVEEREEEEVAPARPHPLAADAGQSSVRTGDWATSSRGVAAAALADRLRGSTLPCTPASTSSALAGSGGADPLWGRRVFAFQTAPSASGAAHEAGDAPPPDRLARQRAVLFDVLCALRQHPTASCECCADAGGAWRLRDGVLLEAAAQAWPVTFSGAMGELLRVADEVAAVDACVRGCAPVLADRVASGAAEEGTEVLDAAAALEVAAARSLGRLCAVLQQLGADFCRWVLEVQTYLLVVCERQASARQLSENEEAEDVGEGGGGGGAAAAAAAPTLLPAPCSLMELVAAVRDNALPLQRCRVLVEDSGCLAGLATTASASATPLAARLLDALIIQASAVQDTSTMDLYRFYVMLLLHTAWPYVLLCTAAIFGFVRDIDPPVWRRQLPRLFRSSFSHVRIGDVSRRCPTDILSLLLNCVGYGDAGAAAAPPPSCEGGSGAGVDAPWVSVPRRGSGGGGGGHRRRGDAAEQHAARAALASARTFVQRSLAAFTRRHRQIALSRTPAYPHRGSTTATEQTAPRLWRTKSVKEILHYIMCDAGGRHDVVAYAQQNQDVRRRVMQVSDAVGQGSGGAGEVRHVPYFPTTIPLGFIAMQAEALAGQQQQQQQHRHRHGARGNGAPTAPPSARSRVGGGGGAVEAEDEDEDEDGGAEESGRSAVLLRRRRGLSLWSLAVGDSAATTADVRLVNILASHEAHYVEDGEDGGGARRRTHQLWMNTTIPCARWVTTALLIPIGVVVQRLQERRLRDLVTLSLLQTVRGSADIGADSARLTTSPPRQSSPARVASATDGTAAPLAALTGARWEARLAVTTAACSFVHALKLVVDVALLRDQERLVAGFLERLRREPRWWVRRTGGGSSAYERLGTAAPAVSAIFADALRGKRLGELVRLTVLPLASDAAAATPPPPPVSSAAATDLLNIFASFRLDFALPDAYARILLPRDLSVYVHPLTGTTERGYHTFFWQRRRRLYVEEEERGRGGEADRRRSSPSPESCGGVAATTAPPGIAMADVWSTIFGYTCALHYAQLTLRDQKKRLHQRDTEDAQVAQSAEPTDSGRSRQHLTHVARGLGSAYHTLGFAVDQLLAFTQSVSIRVVYDLERLVAAVMRNSPEVHSCMELCHRLDTLLLELSAISFPARAPVALCGRERGMQSPAAEAARAAVQRTLEVALDPSRLPVSHMCSSTRNAVEALVAAVSAAAAHRPSAVATALHPLVVRLTFNRFYGTDEETLSYRFR